MANAGKSMGAGGQGQQGARPAGTEAPGERLDEFDLASDLKGRNSLHGNDQQNVHNQRQAQAGETGRTDELMESFEKLDKDTRARADLGKGNRSGEARNT